MAKKDIIDALVYAVQMVVKPIEYKQQTKTEELSQLFIPEGAEKWDKVNGYYIYHNEGNIEQINVKNRYDFCKNYLNEKNIKKR